MRTQARVNLLIAFSVVGLVLLLSSFTLVLSRSAVADRRACVNPWSPNNSGSDLSVTPSPIGLTSLQKSGVRFLDRATERPGRFLRVSLAGFSIRSAVPEQLD